MTGLFKLRSIILRKCNLLNRLEYKEHQLSGFPGALAATIGIFLPSFLFVLLLNPFIPKNDKF